MHGSDVSRDDTFGPGLVPVSGYEVILRRRAEDLETTTPLPSVCTRKELEVLYNIEAVFTTIVTSDQGRSITDLLMRLLRIG